MESRIDGTFLPRRICPRTVTNSLKTLKKHQDLLALEPFFLSYLLLPLGYTSALALLSAKAETALVNGEPEKAIKLLSMARKAPFLAMYRSMCEVNLITAAYAVENFELVEEVWACLEPKLESLRPYAGSALSSYAATLIGRGYYRKAEALLRSPLQEPNRNQRPDNITVRCRALCRANLSSCLINRGRLQEAQELLDSLDQECETSPVLKSLVIFLRAYTLYLDGALDAARHTVAQINLKGLPLLYQAELRYHYATLFARCDDPQSADRVLSEVVWDTSSHRKLTRLRLVAMAEIASARGEDRTALSYYQDLTRLGYRGALTYLRAASLASRHKQTELQRTFLEAAIYLDPESHWTTLALNKLTPLLKEDSA